MSETVNLNGDQGAVADVLYDAPEVVGYYLEASAAAGSCDQGTDDANSQRYWDTDSVTPEV